MSGGKKKQTVGYKYYLGMHMAMFHGPADKLIRVRVDERDAWVGETAGGQIYINKPNLFGGEGREGGVQGYVDIEMGAPAQGQNSYLVSKLGSLIPAFRGVVCAVLRQVYVGMNPYLKPWDFRFQRIHTRQNGLAQWYDAKAEIIRPLSELTPDAVDVATLNLGQASYTYASEAAATGYQLSGFNPGDIVLMDWPAGLTYTAWSSWPNDSDNCGATWRTRFLVKKSDNTWEYHFNNGGAGCAGTSYYFATQAAAAAAAQANPAETITGSTSYRFSMIDENPAGNRGGLSLRIRKIPGNIIQRDMNPAHMLRECLTDPDWGMGYPEADMDDTAFTAAADALYAEGMGMSLLWDRQIPLEDFIKEVLKHIDAVLYVDRTTGKFVLKLIRADYDANSLLLLDESNVERVENVKSSAIGELVNSLTVKYWDGRTGKDATVKLDDIALASLQGAVVGATIEYPGFTNPVIAAQVCARDLRALATPLTSCVVYANRAAAGLNVGHVFKINWPDAKLGNVIMRVNAIAFGDGRNQRVKITCSQDVYSLPAALTAEVPSSWTDPVAAPVQPPHRLVLEAPYYEVVQRKGNDETNTEIDTYPERGYLLAAGDSPSGDAINARLWVDAGAGYTESAQLDFCPYARLAADISPTAETISIDSGVDLDQVAAGTHCQIGNELCKVVSVTDTTLTAKRGVLDTVPVAHVAGEAIMFWDVYATGDDVEYASGETVNAKLLTVTGQGVLDIAAATAGSVTMASRAARPYAPGQLKVNGSYYPATIGGTAELGLSWAHRDRKQQTDGDLLDYTYGNIGPEAGQTYTLRIYGENDILARTETGLSGTSYNYSNELADGGVATEVPYWANVKLLLNMNGANASTTFTDSSPSPRTVTPAGNAQISTAQVKYGSASGLFDGTGDYLTVPASADFDVVSGDITIEAWVYSTTTDTTNIKMICGNRFNNPTARGWSLYTGNASARALGLYVFDSSGNLVVNLSSGSTYIASSTWTHVRVVRSGTTWYMFINGVLVASASQSGTPSAGSTLQIARDVTNANRDWKGHIDDLQIVREALSTSDFTPPDQQLGRYHYDSRLNGKLRFELESVRAGLASYQKHNVTVLREGYGFNYGNYYGGV